MQIQLTKYVNKMQTSVQCEKITFESPTPNNHMFKSYTYKFFATCYLTINCMPIKPLPTNKQYKNSVAYLTECPEFSVENGNAIE